MPYINLILDTLKKETMQRLLITSGLVFSVFPTLFHCDLSNTNGGASFLWLAVLYLVGAYIRKYKVADKAQKKTCLLGYATCVVLTWFSKFGIEIVTSKLLREPKYGGYFVSYTSPTIVLSAVFLLLLFAKLSFTPKAVRFITFVAPVSFDVYLLHEEPLIRSLLINGRFEHFKNLHPILMLGAVIGTALGIWLIGSLVGRLRLAVFKLCRVQKISEWLERKGKSVLWCLLKKLRKKARELNS